MRNVVEEIKVRNLSFLVCLKCVKTLKIATKCKKKSSILTTYSRGSISLSKCPDMQSCIIITRPQITRYCDKGECTTRITPASVGTPQIFCKHAIALLASVTDSAQFKFLVPSSQLVMAQETCRNMGCLLWVLLRILIAQVSGACVTHLIFGSGSPQSGMTTLGTK